MTIWVINHTHRATSNTTHLCYNTRVYLSVDRSALRFGNVGTAGRTIIPSAHELPEQCPFPPRLRVSASTASSSPLLSDMGTLKKKERKRQALYQWGYIYSSDHVWIYNEVTSKRLCMKRHYKWRQVFTKWTILCCWPLCMCVIYSRTLGVRQLLHGPSFFHGTNWFHSIHFR